MYCSGNSQASVKWQMHAEELAHTKYILIIILYYTRWQHKNKNTSVENEKYT